MLYHVPYDTTTANIVGVDPGTNTLGYAVVSFDVRTLALTGVRAYTYTADRMHPSTHIEMMYGARISRLARLNGELLYSYSCDTPVMVMCESPFINTKRPAAYGALVEAVDCIRGALMQYDHAIPFRLVPPSNVKNSIGAKGADGKDAIKLAMLRHPEISQLAAVDQYDEHSIDALAVAYSGLSLVRQCGLHTLFL
jgi:Holliday junction resolvasome RuvABC endonuclease subunit